MILMSLLLLTDLMTQLLMGTSMGWTTLRWDGVDMRRHVDSPLSVVETKPLISHVMQRGHQKKMRWCHAGNDTPQPELRAFLHSGKCKNH